MIETVLASRLDELNGRLATPDEIQRLTSRLNLLVPEWFNHIVSNYPLIGSIFTLAEAEDESGLGVELQWLSPDQIISECFDVYPGIVAHRRGYLPVGSCLAGSGDYYYIQPLTGDTSPLLRIPHEAANEEELREDEIEQVFPNLSDFISAAAIEAAQP